MTENYKEFTNKNCEFFPCHEYTEQTKFNCLFCYCPLYHDLECPGQYTLLTSGIQDCSKCTFPHDPDNYDKIIKLCANLCTRYLTKANYSSHPAKTLKRSFKNH